MTVLLSRERSGSRERNRRSANAGTAEPLRVAPPEAAAYEGELARQRTCYRNLSPEQVVVKAGDSGRYIASERPIRRVLARDRLRTYRNRAKPARPHKPRSFVARAAL